jgi:AcrR family transcriptional regulator
MTKKPRTADAYAKSPFSRTHQREIKLQTILSESARLFNFQGSRGTTLDDIASAIGLTKTSLYYYARNKEELVYLCYLASCDAGDELMAEAETGAANGLACLIRFLELFFARGDEINRGQRPHAAMLVEIPVLAAEHREKIEARVQHHFDTLLGFLQRGIGDGSVTVCAPIPATQALMAMVNWSYVWYGRIPDAERPAAVAQIIDLVKNGISPVPYRFLDLEFPGTEPQLPAGFDRKEQNRLKRNAFLRVGSRMFNERGYMGTSLDEVARQLNVTKGAFYYHIENKEDLLYQCFQRTLELETEMIERACRTGHNGAEKIERVLRHLFNVQHSDAGPLVQYRNLLSLDRDRRTQIRERTQATSDRLGALISEGMADGSIRTVDPLVVENAIAGTVDAAPDIALRMPVDNIEQVSADYLQLFFNGIARKA